MTLDKLINRGKPTLYEGGARATLNFGRNLM